MTETTNDLFWYGIGRFFRYDDKPIQNDNETFSILSLCQTADFYRPHLFIHGDVFRSLSVGIPLSFGRGCNPTVAAEYHGTKLGVFVQHAVMDINLRILSSLSIGSILVQRREGRKISLFKPQRILSRYDNRRHMDCLPLALFALASRPPAAQRTLPRFTCTLGINSKYRLFLCTVFPDKPYIK